MTASNRLHSKHRGILKSLTLVYKAAGAVWNEESAQCRLRWHAEDVRAAPIT